MAVLRAALYERKFVKKSRGPFVPSASTNQPPVAAELQAPRIQANGFTMTLSGGIGQKYQVQVSSNLVDWIPVTTVTQHDWPAAIHRSGHGAVAEEILSRSKRLT